MAVDAWLDTQCGVPEITVSPDECSCEDSWEIYRLLQCQIQGAIPYGKVAPSRCTVRCNSLPIPEAVCCAVPKRDNNGLHGWQGCCPSGGPWYAPVHRCKTTQQSTRSNRSWTCGNGHDFCINGLVPYFKNPVRSLILRRYLSFDSAKLLAHVLVSSRLDYCNSLLFGIADKEIIQLQCIPNSLARVVTEKPLLSRSVPLLRSLHWLPVKFRIEFKTCLLTYKALKINPTFKSSGINGVSKAFKNAFLTPLIPPVHWDLIMVFIFLSLHWCKGFSFLRPQSVE